MNLILLFKYYFNEFSKFVEFLFIFIYLYSFSLFFRTSHPYYYIVTFRGNNLCCFAHLDITFTYCLLNKLQIIYVIKKKRLTILWQFLKWNFLSLLALAWQEDIMLFSYSKLCIKSDTRLINVNKCSENKLQKYYFFPLSTIFFLFFSARCFVHLNYYPLLRLLLQNRIKIRLM